MRSDKGIPPDDLFKDVPPDDLFKGVPPNDMFNATSTKNAVPTSSTSAPTSFRRRHLHRLLGGASDTVLEPIRLLGEGLDLTTGGATPLHELATRLGAYMDQEHHLNNEAAKGDLSLEAASLVGNLISPLSRLPIKALHSKIDGIVGAPALIKLLAKGAGTGVVAEATTHTPGRSSYDKLTSGTEIGALLSGVGGGVGKLVGGAGTIASKFFGGGVGIDRAYKAGLKGGSANSDYWAAFKGKTLPQDIVESLQRGAANLDKARSKYYTEAEDAIVHEPHPIGAENKLAIDAAIKDALNTGTKFGQSVSPDVDRVKAHVEDILSKYSTLQRNGTLPNTAGSLNLPRTQLNILSDSLKTGAAIATQKRVPAVIASAMNEVMKERLPGWSELQAHNAQQEALLKTIKNSLGVTEKEIPNMEAAINKLYKAPNNDFKRELISELEKYGPKNTLEKVAGVRTRSLTPDGLGKVAQAMSIMGGLYNPASLGMAALQTPAIVGPAANLIGSGKRIASPYVSSALLTEIAKRLQINDFNY